MPKELPAEVTVSEEIFGSHNLRITDTSPGIKVSRLE